MVENSGGLDSDGRVVNTWREAFECVAVVPPTQSCGVSPPACQRAGPHVAVCGVWCVCVCVCVCGQNCEPTGRTALCQMCLLGGHDGACGMCSLFVPQVVGCVPWFHSPLVSCFSCPLLVMVISRFVSSGAGSDWRVASPVPCRLHPLLQPVTTAERFVVTVCMLIGACLWAYIVANVCAIVTALDQHGLELKSVRNHMNNFRACMSRAFLDCALNVGRCCPCRCAANRCVELLHGRQKTEQRVAPASAAVLHQPKAVDDGTVTSEALAPHVPRAPG